MSARRQCLGLLCGLAALLLAGCGSAAKPRDYVPMAVRFHLETAGGEGVPFTLPQSGVVLALNQKPVLTEGDVANVELVQVDLGRCVMFQLTPSAARDFYRLSVTHQGRRLALVLDGAAAGARRIDGAIADGVVFMFLERSDDSLPALVENLKKNAAAVQREIARK